MGLELGDLEQGVHFYLRSLIKPSIGSGALIRSSLPSYYYFLMIGVNEYQLYGKPGSL